MNMVYWLIIFFVLVVIEIMTVGLITLWFAFGALAACLATILGANGYVQISIFLAVSIITLLITRPMVKKFVSRKFEKTNVDEIIGRKVEITETIKDSNNYGRAELNGESWMAKSENGELIENGEKAVIVSVEGTKLVVKKVNN